MTNNSSNLRKAAVLLRSVDAETAATLLSQLSMDEAKALREAMRGLGPIDPDEQADVLAEFRRKKPLINAPADGGVELSLSSTETLAEPNASLTTDTSKKRRFEFLDAAPAKTLASYLAREHAQTIAVVLSYLPPERAASVLAALPAKAQVEAMERLSNLGDTDAEVVAMLENELSAWIKARAGDAGHRGRHRDVVASILAAADSTTRDAIVAKLKTQHPQLTQRVRPTQREPAPPPRTAFNSEYRVVKSIAKRHAVNSQLNSLISEQSSAPSPAKLSAPKSRTDLGQIDFDQLVHMDSRILAQLLAVADPNMLALALAGSKDELVDRICDQMPKRIAKAFRRELRQMGPTRLSDVDAAQRAIAELAAKQINRRRAASSPLPQSLSA